MFTLASYTPPHPRLAALTWGADDLAAAVGATGNKEEGGRWTDPYRLARTLCPSAAASARVAPIDPLYPNSRDATGLEADCRPAPRAGLHARHRLHTRPPLKANRTLRPPYQ